MRQRQEVQEMLRGVIHPQFLLSDLQIKCLSLKLHDSNSQSCKNSKRPEAAINCATSTIGCRATSHNSQIKIWKNAPRVAAAVGRAPCSAPGVNSKRRANCGARRIIGRSPREG